jgi:hypothetical protein
MKFNKLLLCTSILMISGFMGCGSEQGGQSVEGDASSRQATVIETSEPKVLEIGRDNEIIGALISLEMSKVFQFSEESLDKDVKGTNVFADLWFDSGDSKIYAISAKMARDEFHHVGADAFVASVVGLSFDELTSVPDSIRWSSRLKQLKPGTIFLAKSSSGFIYKVFLQEFTSKKMVISYLLLEE